LTPHVSGYGRIRAVLTAVCRKFRIMPHLLGAVA
jgi:hypothetical protein